MAFDEGAAVEFALHDDRWHKGEAGTFASEQAQHGHVVHLGGDDRANTELLEDEVEGHADVAVEAGHVWM